VLQLRPYCECCATELAPTAENAFICSFECTFCARCAGEVLEGRCPNCGGELAPRPPRPARLLAKYPASTERIVKPGGCAPDAG
jgi:hypothetical protein